MKEQEKESVKRVLEHLYVLSQKPHKSTIIGSSDKDMQIPKDVEYRYFYDLSSIKIDDPEKLKFGIGAYREEKVDGKWVERGWCYMSFGAPDRITHE
jgi:hypothetical protein